MSSVGASLDVIRQNTIRYGFPVLLILGNFGNLFCMVIFSQKHFRSNSCSLYLLAAASFSFVGVNLGLGAQINAIYRPPDPFTISVTLCRTRGYVLQTAMLLYRTMIVLSCADRFALCSTRPTIRAFSRSKVALIMIGSAILFWSVTTIHLAIFEDIQNGACNIFGLYGLIFSIYLVFIYGLIAPGLMIVFGYFVMRNLKQSRIRVRPIQGINSSIHRILRQRDRNLMKLCLSEVLVCIILTFPYPINTLYSVLANNIPNKSEERKQIEVFMTFVCLLFLHYLNYSITFYLYAATSQSFRREIKRVIYKYLMCQETN